MSPRSVQFHYKRMVEVDLLVSPYWRDQHELYRFLKSVPQDKRKMYYYTCMHFYIFQTHNDIIYCCCRFTVCASKWQVAFFKQQPNEVRLTQTHYTHRVYGDVYAGERVYSSSKGLAKQEVG